MKTVVEHTCEIMCENNGSRMVGEVLGFREKDYLSVSIDRKVKLNMKWNGHVYEGNMAKLNFTTDGPIIRTVKIGRK